MRSLLAVVLGLAAISAGFVMRSRGVPTGRYRGYFFAGQGVATIGLMQADIIPGRLGLVVGLILGLLWLGTGLAFVVLGHRARSG